MTATPAPELQDLLAPGQEDMIDGFLEELEQEQAELNTSEPQQDQQLLAGKFKSTEELEKAYLEAQRLIGQRGQKLPEPQEEAAPLTPEQYTPELGKQLYGDTVATAIEAAQINPLEMAEKVYSGQDVSSYVDALVDKGGLPRQVVETYLQGIAPAKAPSESSAASLTETDVSELKAMVGGEQQFQQLSQWAMDNLEPQELADYNAAVDSGNKAAARFALKQLQVRAAAAGTSEPKLIGGGSAIKADVFESDQQAVDARSKRDKNGKFLYETDPKYRQWYDKTLSRSNVFL
jgi:phosphopantetheinyl transferase (holo-ACP synthase)